MISAERINEYAQMPNEEKDGQEKKSLEIPHDWPHDGKIEFRNYTLRYRPHVHPALKKLNLSVEPRKKIGIIGRTGAGKSSLFHSILRLVNCNDVDGHILIDDVDISHVKLRYLRSRLSVIPQHPVLFEDTLRFNLDPCRQYSDEDCLTALEAVRLKEMVLNSPDSLLFPISTEGSNVSTGQAQLICVARAILRKSKILLIDEATANVDAEADRLFQTAIANKFQDRTILTIAHRLSTVTNYDGIVVLENGSVVDFGTPTAILHKYH